MSLYDINGNKIISEISSDPAATSNNKWLGKVWVALGDSITLSHDASIYYPAIVKDLLGFASVTNNGKAGYTMSTVFSPYSMMDVYQSFDYSGADLVTIAMGCNDKIRVSPIGELSEIGSTELDISTFIGAYQTLIEYIVGQNPDVSIVLMQPIFNVTENMANSGGFTLQDYRDAISDIGKLYHLPVITLETGFNNLTIAEWYADTGTHPNDAGQQKMAESLAAQLLSI